MLITHVMDLSRLQTSGASSVASTVFDLSRLVHDLIQEAQAAYPAVIFEATLPAELKVFADSDRMTQAVVNLLGNARQYGAVGHPVGIVLHEQAGRAVLRFTNVAEPIGEQVLGQLFVPFKRRSVDDMINRSGLGLGLYIAHEVALRHQGQLTYGHHDGRVSFTLQLPIQTLAPVQNPPGH